MPSEQLFAVCLSFLRLYKFKCLLHHRHTVIVNSCLLVNHWQNQWMISQSMWLKRFFMIQAKPKQALTETINGEHPHWRMWANKHHHHIRSQLCFYSIITSHWLKWVFNWIWYITVLNWSLAHVCSHSEAQERERPVSVMKHAKYLAYLTFDVNNVNPIA